MKPKYSWSRYNTLFHSERFGHFLYNALSNTLFKLNRSLYQLLDKHARMPKAFPTTLDKQFLALLREKKVLVENGEEIKLLKLKHCQRAAHCFDSNHIELTICPTLSCNFACPYCFEKPQKSSLVMSPGTTSQLLQFIQQIAGQKNLSIIWSGGEPTLAFETIHTITAQLNKLDLSFDGATLFTNGYLLDRRKILKLNDLDINTVQITLDGLEMVHDNRRIHADGKPTFRHILSNIDVLLNSSYQGHCIIRVNIDKQNQHEFPALQTILLERYKDKRFSVHAGHVDHSWDRQYDQSCILSSEEWADFTIDACNFHDCSTGESLYPNNNLFNDCPANRKNEFVVGPQGDLYKCLNDVGRKEMIVGTIYEKERLINNGLITLYSELSDPFLDAKCLDCSVLPICSGGCSNKRLRAKFFNEDNIEFCTNYKEHLIRYLEAYYNRLLSREICFQVLHPEQKPKLASHPYQIVKTNMSS